MVRLKIQIVIQTVTKIYYYGKSILEAYIPSLGRGRNIVRQIKEECNNDIIYNIEETDSEILFYFKASDLDILKNI